MSQEEIVHALLGMEQRIAALEKKIYSTPESKAIVEKLIAAYKASGKRLRDPTIDHPDASGDAQRPTIFDPL